MIVGKSRRRDVKKVSSWGPQWINATLKGNEPNLGVPQQEQQAWQGGGLDSWGRGGMERGGAGWEAGALESGASAVCLEQAGRHASRIEMMQDGNKSRSKCGVMLALGGCCAIACVLRWG